MPLGLRKWTERKGRLQKPHCRNERWQSKAIRSRDRKGLGNGLARGTMEVATPSVGKWVKHSGELLCPALCWVLAVQK